MIDESQEIQVKKKLSGSVIAGYILCGLALVIFPPGLGLAAFILGIVNAARGEAKHGVIQIVLSIACAIIGFILGMQMGMSN